jgi:hypothetical protein
LDSVLSGRPLSDFIAYTVARESWSYFAVFQKDFDVPVIAGRILLL